MKRGFVVLKTGERLEGEISVKIRKSRGDEDWHFHELEYRPSKDEKKQKFEAAYVQDFGVTFTMHDYANGGKSMSKDPARNFHEVVVRLVDGSELRGHAALAGASIGGYSSLYFASSPTANLENVESDRIVELTQVRNGADFAFVSYRGALQPMTRGKNFLLFRNPRPNTRDDGWGAAFATMGAQIAATAYTGAAVENTRRREEKRLQERVDRGDYLPSVIQDAADTSRRLEQGQQQAKEMIDNVDLGLMKTEYVIRNVRTGFEIIVHDKNLESEVTPLLAACPATARLQKSQRKDLVKFKNIENLIQTLDKCF
jgi:hypothetical protein